MGFIDESPRGKIERGVIGWDSRRGAFHGDERIILAEFWRLMKTFRPNVDRIVGHSVYDFDLKFILKRSIFTACVRRSICRLRVTATNRSSTRCMYGGGYGSRGGLETLARALGFESSKRNGVSGSQIYGLFEAGEDRVIHEYCLKDVERTWAIYKRMVFEECATTPAPVR